MPPALSDEDASDIDDTEMDIPISTRKAAAANRKGNSTAGLDEDDNEDNEMPDVVSDDDAKDGQGDEEGDQDEEGDDDEDLEEDEYIVEKILSHILEADGTIKYKVKWEGYEKKSDQTWEDESNLRENAAAVLDEYLESVGGREKILEESQAALKNKKRGRPSAATPANGTKRRRGESHPGSASPPVSARAWKPPTGSWEDAVDMIDVCRDENTGQLMVYLTWKEGQKTQHNTKIVYSRCPQKMLQYYERHVKIKEE